MTCALTLAHCWYRGATKFHKASSIECVTSALGSWRSACGFGSPRRSRKFAIHVKIATIARKHVTVEDVLESTPTQRFATAASLAAISLAWYQNPRIPRPPTTASGIARHRCARLQNRHYETRAVSIERQANRRGEDAATKTESSVRPIPIPAYPIPELQRWKISCPITTRGLLFPGRAQPNRRRHPAAPHSAAGTAKGDPGGAIATALRPGKHSGYKWLRRVSRSWRKFPQKHPFQKVAAAGRTLPDHGGRSLARAGSKLANMTRYRDGLTCSLRYSVRMGGFVDDDATDQGFDHSGLDDLFRRHFKRIAIEYD